MSIDLTLPPVHVEAIQLTKPPASAPRQARPGGGRRLSDKIMAAFHHACDQGNLDAARDLVVVLDLIAMRAHHFPSHIDRRAKESLVAAHERLWHLRHPEFSWM